MRGKLKKFYLILSVIVFAAVLLPAAAEAAPAAWDGKTIDVSWYSKTGTTFDLSTPAQLAGLAAIVNGSYNTDITTVIGIKASSWTTNPLAREAAAAT